MKAKVILILLLGFSPLIYGQTKTNASQQSVTSYPQSSTTRVNSQPSANVNYGSSHNMSTTTNASPNYSQTSTNNYHPGNVGSANTHVANHGSYNQQPVSYVHTRNTYKENMTLSRRDFSNIRQIIRNTSLSRGYRTEKAMPANCTDASGLEESHQIVLDEGNPHAVPEPIDYAALNDYLQHRDTKEKIINYSATLDNESRNLKCQIYSWRLIGQMMCSVFLVDVGFSTLDSCEKFSSKSRIEYHCPVYYYYDSTNSENKKHHATFSIKRCGISYDNHNISEFILGADEVLLMNNNVPYKDLWDRCRYFRNSYR